MKDNFDCWFGMAIFRCANVCWIAALIWTGYYCMAGMEGEGLTVSSSEERGRPGKEGADAGSREDG